MTTEIIERDRSEFLDVPPSYQSISIPKLAISKAIKHQMVKKNMSIRSLAKNVGMQHPQVVRVTSGENYTIESLLKILTALDLEIVIKEKEGKDN